jgi:DNA-directed RNA polymerase specialized sigma24 family protein
LPSALGVPGTGDGDLWQAVAALPDKQRQAVAYHYVAGLAYAEIAGILGGTTDAARKAAADGVKNLRSARSCSPRRRRAWYAWPTTSRTTIAC